MARLQPSNVHHQPAPLFFKTDATSFIAAGPDSVMGRCQGSSKLSGFLETVVWAGGLVMYKR